ncbi:hypothetical protein [Bartonella bovis]|uniref:hypothetical protein n=1 Tax=Bartonella bovis TaxID=155194 RepID=UPI0011AF45FA|nr:hypothetical protein [Bartonella bovis]
MNMKRHVINPVAHNQFSTFVVEQKQKTKKHAEITISDIATKLRYVYTQMQIKKMPNRLIMQSFVDNSIKSYLDTISRAILAEHSARDQAQKKLFERLEQIEKLVQKLLHEKNSSQETVMKRYVPRAQSIDSVVHRLAHMTYEEN